MVKDCGDVTVLPPPVPLGDANACVEGEAECNGYVWCGVRLYEDVAKCGMRLGCESPECGVPCGR